MKKLAEKKEYVLIGIVVLMFVFVSYLSFTSIHHLRGTARVVNYAGIVRGATQRLVKKELQGYPDDALRARLDSIVEELITGEGPNDLVVLNDEDYLNNMNRVRNSWTELKAEIDAVREGGDKTKLFDMSEDYFVLVDHTVSSAEIFSEKQVSKSTNMLVGVNVVLVAMILGGILALVRSMALKKRADALGKIAYLDPLTQIANRACCEQEIDKYARAPDVELAVFMFDMNNLKRANDELGHQGGDRIIADFARIIKNEGADYGFVGRYGGDEFIAVFPQGDEHLAQTYLTRINEKVIAYNLLHLNEIERISFAAGYVIGNTKSTPLTDMINEADKLMYNRKRQMKEDKEV